jgi:hypothetical protein
MPVLAANQVGRKNLEPCMVGIMRATKAAREGYPVVFEVVN